MPHPYVTKVTLKDNQIVLTIQVDDYPTGEPLEISGHATQNGGAFAVFNDIRHVPGPNPDGTAYIYVTAPASQPFVKGHAVTVVLRAATVWATVLEEGGEEEPSTGISETISRPDLAEEGTSKAAAIGGLTCDGAGRVALVWRGAAA